MSDKNIMEAMLLRQHESALARLAANPNDRMAKLLTANREQALADLRSEQRLDDAQKLGELIEIRLHGPRVDRGAIPLDSFIKVTTPFLRALKSIAERHRFGVSKLGTKHKRQVSDSLNIKLAGLAMGSTRLLLTGDGIADTGGESLLHMTMERTLGLLNAPSDSFFEAIDTVGITAANAIGDFAAAVEAGGMSVEINWPFGEKSMHWEGRADELLRIKNLLQSVESPDEHEMDLIGEVASISDTGRIHMRVLDLGKVTVRYSLDKTHLAQKLAIKTQAKLRVLASTYWDPSKQVEVSKYNLL